MRTILGKFVLLRKSISIPKIFELKRFKVKLMIKLIFAMLIALINYTAKSSNTRMLPLQIKEDLALISFSNSSIF